MGKKKIRSFRYHDTRGQKHVSQGVGKEGMRVYIEGFFLSFLDWEVFRLHQCSRGQLAYRRESLASFNYSIYHYETHAKSYT